MRFPAAVFFCLVCACLAPTPAFSREITVEPAPLAAPPPFLTPVAASNALCAAVNPDGSLLVVGHRAAAGQHLAVFRLDAQGRPAGAPTRLALPKPTTLATNANYPLGLLFHPRRPVLYVWQDITAPPQDRQEKHAAFVPWLEFDHLLIYSVTPAGLELSETAAHGAGFHCGLNGGTVGLDADAKTLFLPNSTGATYDEAGIAFYALDENGLPVDADTAGAAQSRSRTAKPKLGATRFARTVASLQRKRTHRYYPSGAGWFAGAGAMLMGGYAGCLVADFDQSGLRQSWFSVPEPVGHCVLAGHPSLPAAYLAVQNTPRLVQIAHAEGYLSLLPQIAFVKGAQFLGAPVVLPQPALLAAATTASICFLGIDADGRLDGKVRQLPLPGLSPRAMTWSAKHQRLYVAVDKPN